MDPSALESVSRSLESSLDSLGVRLLIATALVAVGLVLEYWHPISEFIAEIRRPMTVFRWEKFMEISGAILITVGVAGEFWFTYEASRVETKLRENNHNIEESLTAKADGEATARVQIEESIAPRRIATKQRLKMSSELSRFAGQPVIAFHNVFDVEASVFAVELLSTLRSAKWNTHPHIWVGGNVGNTLVQAPAIPVTGILVQGGPDGRSRSAARAVVEELSRNGFDSRIVQKGVIGFGPGSRPVVGIKVEPRPDGPQGEAKMRIDAEKTKQMSNNHIPSR